jgi:hypothetical protein
MIKPRMLFICSRTTAKEARPVQAGARFLRRHALRAPITQLSDFPERDMATDLAD